MRLAIYWPTNVDSSSPQIVWDSFKAVVRGEYISAIKAARNTQNSMVQTLQERETACALEHAAHTSLASLTALRQAQRDVALQFSNQTQCIAQKCVYRLFEEGDKNGKLLVLLTTEIHAPAGSLQTSGREFFRHLWSFIKLCIPLFRSN